MEHFSPTPSPIGGRSFIDHARVRILLAPAGDVSEADFGRWCDYVRSFETIRLTDLPPKSEARKVAAASSSAIMQTGEIHLSFVTSYDPEHSFLAPFDLHRQVLGVLGLTSFSHSSDVDELERTPAALRQLHPGAISHRLFAFDTGAKRPETVDLSSIKNTNSNKTSPSAGSSSTQVSSPSEAGFSSRKDGGLIIFPAVRKDGKDIKFYLRTLLAEFVAGILDGLDQVVSDLEGTPLETPRETLEGIAQNKAAGRASNLFTPFGSGSRSSNAVGGGSQPGSLVNSSASSNESMRSKIIAANANKKPKRVTSMTGTGPIGTGRFAKVKADFHLLCGNLWEALEGYSASLNALGKERALAGGQDAVWFASALEGFSVTRVLVSRMGGPVLEKAPSFDLPWSGRDKEKEREKDGIPRPYAKESWAEVAEAYTIALIIYSKCLAPPSVLLEAAKSVTNETPRDFTHPLIHAGACVQYARFLLAVWASSGWNGECFDQLVYGGIPPSLAEDRPTLADYHRLSGVSGIARHDIAAAASSALTHSVVALKPSDQITLLSTLTGIFGCIGFSRREAYLLRQLQDVICKLLEKAIKFRARPPETFSLPLQCQPLTEDEVLGNMIVQITTDAVGRGPQAILVLAMQICETYGIHVEVEPLRNVPATHILSKASDGLRSAYASPTPPSQEWTTHRTRQRSQPQPRASTAAPPSAIHSIVTPLEMQNEAPFGWKEQQISLLKDTISVAEMLGDHLGMSFFAVVLLRDFYPLLAPEEQRDLMHGIRRTVEAARWQGAHTLTVKYWGPPEPLSHLELVTLSSQRQPLAKPYSELKTASTSANIADEGIAGLNNPFYWNPGRDLTSAKNRTTAVQDEAIEVIATLENPFSVELDIESLKLVTEGVEFEAISQHIALPPLSFQTIRLSGVASETGQLSVKGVSIVLVGCAEETFLLPIPDKDSDKANQTAAAEADDRRTRIKVVGLDARSSVLKQRHNARPEAVPPKKAQPGRSGEIPNSDGVTEAKYMQVQVVPAQPLLSVYCSELGATRGLELYEGEMQMIHLELRNTSEKLPVNVLKIQCSDDLSDSVLQAASTGELLPGDIHDLYADLLHNPTLQQRSDAKPSNKGGTFIEAGASIILPMLVRGKKGCTSANVTVEYGHIDEKVRQMGTTFYARKVDLAFAVLVRPVLVCSALNVSPLRAAEAAKLTARSLLASQPSQTGPTTGAATADAITHSRAGDEDTEATLIAATTDSENAPLDDSSFCLISLDVTSVHPVDDVVVRFALNTGGVHPLRISKTVRPGATARFELPLPRLSLSAEHVAREITSLSSMLSQPQRQFIVSKIQLSAEEEVGMRKRFWYQQELVERWQGSWSLVASTGHGTERDSEFADVDESRFGDIFMHFVSLNDKQVSVLARDPLKVELEFSTSTNKDDASMDSSILAEMFTCASITVTNQASRALRLHVRLIPVVPISALHPSIPGGDARPPSVSQQMAPEDAALTHVLIADGTSTSSPSPCSLLPGEATTLKTQVLFLATGVFAFIVAVDEITPSAASSAHTDTSTRPDTQPRISFTSCPTNVHVQSPE